jgi:hypothetical protein
MINDPYIEIISKTKSLHLDEALVQKSIDIFMKDGADKTWAFLIHEKKTPEDLADKLMKEIKKELRASYFASALIAGAFAILLLTLIIVFLNATWLSVWPYLITIVCLRCVYATIKNLIKALKIK